MSIIQQLVDINQPMYGIIHSLNTERGWNYGIYQGVSRIIAFPEYMEDNITQDNPVRVIEAFVDSLG